MDLEDSILRPIYRTQLPDIVALNNLSKNSSFWIILTNQYAQNTKNVRFFA